MTDDFASRLKTARMGLGISQSELGRRVGVTASAIQLMEAGTTQRTRYLNRIAGILGVDPNWLETGDGSPKRAATFALPDPSIGDFRPDMDDGFLGTEIAREPSSNADLFPALVVNYDSDRVPLFCATHPAMVRTWDDRLRGWADELVRDFRGEPDKRPKNPPDPDRAVRHFVETQIAAIETDTPDGYLPRVHFLSGVREAYAIYPFFVSYGRPRIVGREILYVDPFRESEYGDLVVVWHASNTFTVAEYRGESNGRVRILFPWGEGSGCTLISISLKNTLGIHVVAGIEYSWTPVPDRLKALEEEMMHDLTAAARRRR